MAFLFQLCMAQKFSGAAHSSTDNTCLCFDEVETLIVDSDFSYFHISETCWGYEENTRLENAYSKNIGH